MRRTIWTVVTALTVAALLAPLLAARGAQEQADVAKLIESFETLDWFEGRWKGTIEGRRFEALYTSPEGGVMLSVNKEFSGERLAGFEFERFEVRADGIWVTPYPYGKASVSFRLREHDADARRAVFTNAEHDFPQVLDYHRVDEERMVVHVTGQRGGAETTLVLDMQRVE